MGYRVIARFLHKASGHYIDPGQECPPLPVEDAKRLIRARCLVEEKDDPPAAPPVPRKARASQGTAAPPRQEAAPPPEERGRPAAG